jgi:hypothetical protein
LSAWSFLQSSGDANTQGVGNGHIQHPADLFVIEEATLCQETGLEPVSRVRAVEQKDASRRIASAQQPWLRPPAPETASPPSGLRFRFAPPPSGYGGGEHNPLTNKPVHSVGADHFMDIMSIAPKVKRHHFVMQRMIKSVS